jgi:hypothetical protein
MSWNASLSGLTLFQFGEGNLWHEEQAIWCALALCGKSEYFFGAGAGLGRVVRTAARLRGGVELGSGTTPKLGVEVPPK